MNYTTIYHTIGNTGKESYDDRHWEVDTEAKSQRGYPCNQNANNENWFSSFAISNCSPHIATQWKMLRKAFWNSLCFLLSYNKHGIINTYMYHICKPKVIYRIRSIKRRGYYLFQQEILCGFY